MTFFFYIFYFFYQIKKEWEYNIRDLRDNYT